jgi:hypothetical protein
VSERAPYSRVYWTILSDPKFRSVRCRPELLGTWLLLLVTADAMYPAPAMVPGILRRGHLSALVDAGLVDLEDGGLYRIHGLDAERKRRADAARRDPRRDPDGTQTGPNRDPDGSLDETRRDETSLDETRLDETRLDEDEPHVVAYFNATGRAPTAPQRAVLWELYDRHSLAWLVEHLTGDDPFRAALDADSAWQAERRLAVRAEEAEARREKRRQAYLDKQALMRLSTEVTV